MPGPMAHTPADVIRKLLTDLGLGAYPPATPWPVYWPNEPTSPDDVITVKDTSGRDGGRIQPTGERAIHHGFQVRIRSGLDRAGARKANAIAIALDGVYRRVVVMQSGTAEEGTYLVHQVTRAEPLSLGTENPTSKRVIFTINGLVTLRQIS
jgi:hypothetical protein